MLKTLYEVFLCWKTPNKHHTESSKDKVSMTKLRVLGRFCERFHATYLKSSHNMHSKTFDRFSCHGNRVLNGIIMLLLCNRPSFFIENSQFTVWSVPDDSYRVTRVDKAFHSGITICIKWKWQHFLLSIIYLLSIFMSKHYLITLSGGISRRFYYSCTAKIRSVQ